MELECPAERVEYSRKVGETKESTMPMNILVKITFVEMAVLLVYGYCLTKRFLLVSALTVVGVGLAAQSLQESFGLLPWDVVIGEEVVKSKYMKAAVYSPELGVNYDAIFDEKVKVPNHSEKQVLVKVDAASLNPVNFKLNEAVMPFYRLLKKNIPGHDFSGTIVSVGSDPSCSSFLVYDAVFGFSTSGSLAQYTTAFCSRIAKKPNSLTHLKAGALPITFLTSLYAFDLAHASVFSRFMPALMKQAPSKGSQVRNFLNSLEASVAQTGNFKQYPAVNTLLQNYKKEVSTFKLNKDKIVVVIGGSGGCGIQGIQLGTMFGFNEIISINSEKNAEFVKSIGATKTVNYKDEDELKEFLEEYAGRVSFVYDTVSSGDSPDPHYYESFSKLLNHDDPNRKYVAINGYPTEMLVYGLLHKQAAPILDKAEEYFELDYDLFDHVFPESDYDLFLLNQYVKLLMERTRVIFDSGAFEGQVVIDSQYNLVSTANVISAFKKMRSRRAVGKIMVIP